MSRALFQYFSQNKSARRRKLECERRRNAKRRCHNDRTPVGPSSGIFGAGFPVPHAAFAGSGRFRLRRLRQLRNGILKRRRVSYIRRHRHAAQRPELLGHDDSPIHPESRIQRSGGEPGIRHVRAEPFAERRHHAGKQRGAWAKSQHRRSFDHRLAGGSVLNRRIFGIAPAAARLLSGERPGRRGQFAGSLLLPDRAGHIPELPRAVKRRGHAFAAVSIVSQFRPERRHILRRLACGPKPRRRAAGRHAGARAAHSRSGRRDGAACGRAWKLGDYPLFRAESGLPAELGAGRPFACRSLGLRLRAQRLAAAPACLWLSVYSLHPPRPFLGIGPFAKRACAYECRAAMAQCEPRHALAEPAILDAYALPAWEWDWPVRAAVVRPERRRSDIFR